MKIFEVPEGWREIRKIDLVNDKKAAILVNVLAIVIAGVVLGVGALFVPINFTVGSLLELMKPAFIILISVVAYLVLHELTHGIFIKKYSGVAAKYGTQGGYAFAKSEAFYNKSEYIIIALAPVVAFGVLCLVLNIALGETLFWYIYTVQIVNLSGAAGDFYVTWSIRKLPKNILVKDDGTSMTIYSK